MKEKVLLVEDDPDLLDILQSVLSRYGYNVHSADTGFAAIELLKTQDSGVELVVTDIRMPKLGGLELVNWIRSNQPELPYILMTGYSEGDGPQTAEEVGAAGFLAKPFRKQTLIELIETTLKNLVAGGGQQSLKPPVH